MLLARLGLAGAVAAGALLSSPGPAAAAIVVADGAYYTFGANVSGNSAVRLLADKGAVIGFPERDTVSFLRFEPAELETLPLGPNGRAFLRLYKDSALAPTLITATDDRPVSLSVYALTATFDEVGGNIADIDYGAGGVSAFATELVGDDGLYRWDVTELLERWIDDPTTNFGLALSGVFGNIDIDGRNSYGIFRTINARPGLAPAIEVVSEPRPLLILMGLAALSLAHLSGLWRGDGRRRAVRALS